MIQPAERLHLQRLVLVPVDDALRGARRAGTLLSTLGATLAPDWDGCNGMLDAWDAAPAGHPSARGWGPWLGLVSGQWILYANFYGPPDANGDVEIGYEVAPSARREGLAVEAVNGLTGWAFARGARRVLARIPDGEAASEGVARRCWFAAGSPEQTPVRVWVLACADPGAPVPPRRA